MIFIMIMVTKTIAGKSSGFFVSQQQKLGAVNGYIQEMMNGQKWKAFVYDLSFIGWGILSTITFGLAGVFYVSPYKYQSDAALFEALYGGTDDADDNFESYVEV